MVGRPRRRHAVTHDGRLRAESGMAPLSQHSTKKRVRVGLKIKPRHILWGVGAILLILALWFLSTTIRAFGQVVDKNSSKKAPILNFLGNIDPNKLDGEGDGRVNVLLIGVGGKNHPGGNLADTIMVASFDPKNKEVALLSVPRDLYVPIPGTKSSSKINAVHSYGEQDPKKYESGPALMKKTVTQILDLPIHYYIRADFTALENIVDTLGGITVDVENPIVDLSYPADNMIDFAPFRLKAGVQSLNGETALKFVRSRHASGSEGSDFARSKRQQKVISAIKDKALSAGFLTNPKKMNDVITILGNHLKTDMSITELERFVKLWKDISDSNIVNTVLDNGPNGPLVSQSGDERGYILLPRDGDFEEVQRIAHEIFTDPYLREEKATIAVLNASGSTATTQQVMSLLKSYGYKATDITPKGQAKIEKTALADITNSKPYTKKFLESRFKVSATKGSPLPQTTVGSKPTASPTSYDMVLTIGSNYSPAKVNNVQPKASTSPTPSPKATASSAAQR